VVRNRQAVGKKPGFWTSQVKHSHIYT